MKKPKDSREDIGECLSDLIKDKKLSPKNKSNFDVFYLNYDESRKYIHILKRAGRTLGKAVEKIRGK